jgi:proteic killer suppression protein
VIRSFADEETRQLYLTGKSRRFGNIARAAARKIEAVDFAKALDDLRNPPGNHLEKLHGDREGEYSIRVNDQYRVCFRWQGEDAWDVEVVDYH